MKSRDKPVPVPFTCKFGTDALLLLCYSERNLNAACFWAFVGIGLDSTAFQDALCSHLSLFSTAVSSFYKLS